MGSEVTKYYYAGTQRIAMRENGTLTYILGDHLGSTSLVTDSNGAVISETKYKAWGEIRYSSGANPTDYTYTGQYSYTSDFGLMFYNARWYDPSLGRFAQADTIVPLQSQGVQAWDRYAYVNNSPINYTDPTGHFICSNNPNSDDYCPGNNSPFGNGGESGNGGGGGGGSNVDDIIDDSPQPDFTVGAPSANGAHDQGCIYSGNGYADCTDLILYIISDEKKQKAFFEFLIELDKVGINDLIEDIGKPGASIIFKKFGAEILEIFFLPADLIDNEITAGMQEFTNSANTAMYEGKGNNVVITSQTYFEYTHETEPYIQVSAGSASSILYNGPYTDDILTYLVGGVR